MGGEKAGERVVVLENGNTVPTCEGCDETEVCSCRGDLKIQLVKAAAVKPEDNPLSWLEAINQAERAGGRTEG